jgi:hypothetical protein
MPEAQDNADSGSARRDGVRPAVIFDVDGVLVDSPHERAWQEALAELMAGPWRDVAAATAYAPDRFTSEGYQTPLCGKPRLSGARSVLDYFCLPDLDRLVIEYAEH